MIQLDSLNALTDTLASWLSGMACLKPRCGGDGARKMRSHTMRWDLNTELRLLQLPWLSCRPIPDRSSIRSEPRACRARAALSRRGCSLPLVA